MPIWKSQAQKEKFAELLKQGKISQKHFDLWNSETGNRKLPERLGEKKDGQTKKKKRRVYK